ncbi:unnamed protein product [Onchocerca flexuosa]|uniref:Apple domain-containing protein n=1 Tax=Onchocerca flexuosa TaxID=387005 RepID=A0A183H434_9BILA|nr:unnamed protein product [Onchocerca flexuosa]
MVESIFYVETSTLCSRRLYEEPGIRQYPVVKSDMSDSECFDNCTLVTVPARSCNDNGSRSLGKRRGNFRIG